MNLHWGEAYPGHPPQSRFKLVKALPKMSTLTGMEPMEMGSSLDQASKDRQRLGGVQVLQRGGQVRWGPNTLAAYVSKPQLKPESNASR